MAWLDIYINRLHICIYTSYIYIYIYIYIMTEKYFTSKVLHSSGTGKSPSHLAASLHGKVRLRRSKSLLEGALQPLRVRNHARACFLECLSARNTESASVSALEVSVRSCFFLRVHWALASVRRSQWALEWLRQIQKHFRTCYLFPRLLFRPCLLFFVTSFRNRSASNYALFRAVLGSIAQAP